MLLIGRAAWAGFQRGYIYEASGCFYVRYWTTEIIEGRAQRVQRSEKLCEKNDKYYARTAKAVKLLRDDFMHKLNQGAGQPSCSKSCSRYARCGLLGEAIPAVL